MKLFLRWLITAAAVLVTVWLMPGIRIEGNSAILTALIVAVILGFANAIIRPILAFLSCGCIVATLGLFMLVVNAATLWISSWIALQFGVGFYVDGFWAALFGSIVISIVSFVLSLFLIDDKER